MNLHNSYDEDAVAGVQYESVAGANWSHILNLTYIKNKMKENNDGDKGVVYLELKDKDGVKKSVDWPHMTYEDLKDTLRKTAEDIFVTYDTVVGGKGTLSFSHYIKEDFVLYRTVGDKKVFWGEDVNINTEGKTISRTCICLGVVYDGRVYDFYFPVPDSTEESIEKFIKNFKNGMLIKFSAMRLEKTEKVDKNRVKRYAYLVNSFITYEDKFYDVAHILPKIKSVDDLFFYSDIKTKEPLYEEVVNRLVLYDVLYMQPGEPVFNLVLSGDAGCGKTWMVDLHTKIFGKVSGVSIAASLSTSRGFVPNFGEKKPQLGMLIEPRNFMKGIQEMFRGVCSETREKDKTGAIEIHLVKFMNVIERGEFEAGSGYGRINIQLRDSILATDNLTPDVRVALSSIIKKDTALIRRVTYLWLGEDAVNAVRNAYPVGKDEYIEGILRIWEQEKGLSKRDLMRYGEWFRKVALTVNIDGVRCNKIVNDMTREILEGILAGHNVYKNIGPALDDVNKFTRHMLMQLNLRAFMIALVQCNAVFRATIEQVTEGLPVIEAKQEDYDLAQKLFMRLWGDSFEIAREGIWGAFDEYGRGIGRTFRGGSV